MNAEQATHPPETASVDDDDYGRPWWSMLLPSTLLREKKKRRTVVSDCRRMLRYVLDEGSQIPATLTETIAQIDRRLIATGRRPLSEVPSDVIEGSKEESLAKVPTSEPAPSINELI